MMSSQKTVFIIKVIYTGTWDQDFIFWWRTQFNHEQRAGDTCPQPLVPWFFQFANLNSHEIAIYKYYSILFIFRLKRILDSSSPYIKSTYHQVFMKFCSTNLLWVVCTFLSQQAKVWPYELHGSVQISGCSMKRRLNLTCLI